MFSTLHDRTRECFCDDYLDFEVSLAAIIFSGMISFQIKKSLMYMKEILLKDRIAFSICFGVRVFFGGQNVSLLG